MPNGDTEQIDNKVNLYEEYTYFADSTQTLADRRQSVTQLYLGVQTSIFGLMTFLLSQSGRQQAPAGQGCGEGWNELVLLPLFFVGILICYAWYSTIDHYRRLIGWRFEQLKAMEAKLQGSHRMFTREWEEYFQPGASKGSLSFSNQERRLPLIVVCLYVVYGVALLVRRLFGL